VLVTSLDANLRAHLRRELTAMRWEVREAAGGAEAMELLEEQGAEAMVLDSTLPDLEVSEFADQMRSRHPLMDLLRIDGTMDEAGARSPRRNELLHALRQAQQDTRGHRGAVERVTGADEDGLEMAGLDVFKLEADGAKTTGVRPTVDTAMGAKWPAQTNFFEEEILCLWPRAAPLPLPEMVGESHGMLELARLIRLVAPRLTTVLIEGETGTGKELVARAVHQLSTRSKKPFVVLNCAAIPETLLEAELFGHTRGAFTGAVQSRMGRIEAAHGGTLFLDEIGEMPLGLQAKMLRFLESGELQRVGDNETVRVEVRVIAATHEPLQQRAAEDAFRLDLYHRLAVFPVSVPALRERMEDVLLLATHLLDKLGAEMPVKRLSADAARRLMEHDWPGNVRELAHVLERATILAEDRREISREEIRF
jgi:DNA-binding NtrC family response regulator